MFDKLPFKVILDYGHNPAAMHAMADLVRRLDVRGRRIGVIAAPGDRRDEDIAEIARAAAGAFDYMILRRDDDPRGRDQREVPELMAKALRAAGIAEDRFAIVIDEAEAIEAGLAAGKPGDLVVIFADNLTRSWKQIIYFGGGDPSTAVGEPTLSPVTVQPATAPAAVAPPVTDDEPTITSSGGRQVIADSRGVRLARETED